MSSQPGSEPGPSTQPTGETQSRTLPQLKAAWVAQTEPGFSELRAGAGTADGAGPTDPQYTQWRPGNRVDSLHCQTAMVCFTGIVEEDLADGLQEAVQASEAALKAELGRDVSITIHKRWCYDSASTIADSCSSRGCSLQDTCE